MNEKKRTLIQHKLKKIWKLLFSSCFGLVYFPIAWLWTKQPRDPVALAIAEIIMLGFFGSSKSSLSARLLSRQLKNGQVHGIFFVGDNIGTQEDLLGLKKLFSCKSNNTLVAIDHEGGAVQRISKQHGVTKLPRALTVGTSKLNFINIKSIYFQAGKELKKWGFNVNFGPVLDVHDPKNMAIGRYGRSFGGNSNNISYYGAAFVDGFSSAGIVCALKHFPGHGHSKEDSHYHLADISDLWSEEELEPYKQLIEMGCAPMIMCGHLRLTTIEPLGVPATLSKKIIQDLLRNRLKFNGVIITDDLDMEAISSNYTRRNAVINALQAGNDIILIRNFFNYDPLLPIRIHFWIKKAIKHGEISEQQIFAAANRVKELKNKLTLHNGQQPS